MIRNGPNTVSEKYGFKHRAQWVFWGSPSSRERAQWVPLGLLFVCQSELTEFFFRRALRVCRRTQWGSVRLSEFSSPRQYSRNSIPPDFPIWEQCCLADQSTLVDASLRRKPLQRPVLVLTHATKRLAERLVGACLATGDRIFSRGDKRAPFERALCSSCYPCIAWPFLGLVIAHFNSLSAEAIERRWGRGGKKAWKGGVRRLRPKFWQRTKCTFEKCTFVPSWSLRQEAIVSQNCFAILWLVLLDFIRTVCNGAGPISLTPRSCRKFVY